MVLNWKTTPDEARLIQKIVNRASNYTVVNKLELSMDITAVHKNSVPLKLNELLEAPDFDFTHDVFGIQRYIDRATGKLDRFLPRFADTSKLD